MPASWESVVVRRALEALRSDVGGIDQVCGRGGELAGDWRAWVDENELAGVKARPPSRVRRRTRVVEPANRRARIRMVRVLRNEEEEHGSLLATACAVEPA